MLIKSLVRWINEFIKMFRHSIKRKLELVQKLEKKLKKESLSINTEDAEKLSGRKKKLCNSLCGM